MSVIINGLGIKIDFKYCGNRHTVPSADTNVVIHDTGTGTQMSMACCNMWGEMWGEMLGHILHKPFAFEAP